MNAARPPRLVVCVNQRLGAGQRSCAGSGSRDLIQQLKTHLTNASLDVPIVERECLGRCEQGPAMRIAPGGQFFTEVGASDLVAIVDQLREMVEANSRQKLIKRRV